MTKQAASLVASAKEWATNYGDYSNGIEGAAYTAPLRARAAWDANDADHFAGMFTDNGSMLVGDRQLQGPDEIRTYMAEAFGGAYKGSKLTMDPREVHLVTDSVAIAITEGDVSLGTQEAGSGGRSRSMWVLAKRDGDWRIAVYQSSPITG